MEKDESKAAAAEEQLETPADAPRDGEGCEAVTVVIIAQSEKHGELAAKSVKTYLIGVDCDVHVVTGENLRDTDIETLLEHLPYVTTERVIVMTEGMLILNPVTLHDIAIPKARLVKTIPDYGCVKAPVMYFRTVLNQLLPALAAEKPYASLADEYYHGICPGGYTPINVGDDWRQDPFVLPVVSKEPPVEKVKRFAEWKKFIYVSPKSWSTDLVKFLEERFPV